MHRSGIDGEDSLTNLCDSLEQGVGAGGGALLQFTVVRGHF